MQPAKTQILHSGRQLPPLTPKNVEMALMKSGMSVKEYEANKRRCEQDTARYAAKVMGNTALIGAMTAGCEALALVDDRLGGEGTGKILGVNDPVLGWVIIGVFGTVWALYAVSTKTMPIVGDGDGLGLDS